jgi:serine/threonine-protein kinase
MAEVFLAVALGLEGFQRRLVIKRMLPHLSQDPSFVRMFIDEAKLSGLLSHPNLVQIYEFGKVGESFFIAMEHVYGEPLSAVQAKLVEAGRVAPVAASLEIARQVCIGLQYAHSLQSAEGQPLGVVHRDISPSNVMLSFHGGVKVLDFGIARVAEGLRDSRTQVGTMKGKVSYMSPQQIRMEPVDHRADIFAVGIVLHEMLTGQRLFKATNEYTSARMVLESVVPLPSSVNAEVPEAVDRMVMHALERNADERYQTAAEMAEELEQVLVEMKASPQEPRKLLSSLFPNGPSHTGTQWLATPSPGATPSPSPGGSPPPLPSNPPWSAPIDHTRQLARDVPVPIEEGSLVSASELAAAAARRGRRQLLTRILLAGAAVAALVMALRPRTAPAPTAVVAAVAAQPAAAAVPAPPPSKPPVVELSFDSSPQDAQVIREDSGAVVGRTPMTIALPQAREAISFRFEKPGHTPVTHRVIPDLDKSVRVDLVRAPVAVALTPRRPLPGRRPPPGRARPITTREERAGAGAEAPSAVEQPRDCALSVASFPWTELWIDGKDTGQRTPVVHYPVACGAHKLGLKRRDLKMDRVEQVTVAPGHELKQHYEFGDDFGD